MSERSPHQHQRPSREARALVLDPERRTSCCPLKVLDYSWTGAQVNEKAPD